MLSRVVKTGNADDAACFVNDSRMLEMLACYESCVVWETPGWFYIAGVWGPVPTPGYTFSRPDRRCPVCAE